RCAERPTRASSSSPSTTTASTPAPWRRDSCVTGPARSSCSAATDPGKKGEHTVDYTLADLVGMSARSRPDHIAAVELGDPDRAFTYRQLWERVGDLADALRHTPAGPNGPMVATLMPNSLDALASYLACQVAGVGAVPINIRLADREIAHILTDPGAKVVLAAGECLETARRVAADGVEVVDAATVEPSGRFREFAADPSRG